MPSKYVKGIGRTLDARPDRLDLRDRLYTPPVVTLPPQFPSDAEVKTWLPAYAKSRLTLDQGEEGACTGFGLACVVHYLLWRRQMEIGSRQRVVQVSTRMLYHLARFYDEWPGEDYDGSSCRGALKAWHRHGVCSLELWPYLDARGKETFVAPSKGWDRDAMQRRVGVYYRINGESVVDIQAAIREIGAVYVSANVHDGWDFPTARKTLPITGHKSLPVIAPVKDPDSVGGHAFALIGYNPKGFVVQNSWGPTWGRQGFAVLPYEDWVSNGTDAWACALGVPADTTLSPGVMVPSKSPRRRAGAARPVALRIPRPTVSPAVAPWSLDEAYRHTVVMGNEGRVINRVVTHASGTDGVRALVAEAPRAFFKGRSGPARIAIYAHGGLNSEDESLQRIQVLAPYFKANGIYPLFLTWRTGPLETLDSILEDEVSLAPRQAGAFQDLLGTVTDRIREAADRTIEVLARPVVKPIWTEMKQNAEASAEADGGSALVAEHLATLARTVKSLEIHLVGHSAGAILLGHLLSAAGDRKLQVKSCTLFAPACTVRFAVDRYVLAVKAGVLALDDLHLHVLSDEREREDSVGPYGKSLLYLVSRALEATHKTPLLGLARAFDDAPAVVRDWAEGERVALGQWQAFWRSGPEHLHTLSKAQVSTGTRGRGIASAHGCFDNDADSITETLRRILSAMPAQSIESLDF